MIGVNVTQPDITLVLDNEGVITEATVANTISGEAVTGWLGRPWFETVGQVGSDRVRRMIEDARATGLSAFGQVTQLFPSGRELPIEYATARLAGRSGLIAIGKNLHAVAELQSRLIAAQHAREQEYWKLREVETRYRLLFDASNEAVLVVHPETLRVTERNMFALKALGLGLDGDIAADVAPGDREPLLTMLSKVRDQGRAPAIIVHIGMDRRAWTVRASLLSNEPGSSFLLQLSPIRAVPTGGGGADMSVVATLIDRLPDGFVVLDQDGVIRHANRAFLDLTQTALAASVIGQRLSRWMVVPGSDAQLVRNVQRYRSVHLFSTVLEGELGTELAVEITAVGDSDTSPSHFGVVLRDATRRAPRKPENDQLETSLRKVSGRIGAAPMPDLVRATVEAIERRCIAEALDRAGGNRSAAAELLGLSRQSLYVKLSRYGIDAADAEDT